MLFDFPEHSEVSCYSVSLDRNEPAVQRPTALEEPVFQGHNLQFVLPRSEFTATRLNFAIFLIFGARRLSVCYTMSILI